MNNRTLHLRPSGAASWSVCEGYVAMCAAYPELPEEGSHEVREDGTACHWLAKELYDGIRHAIDELSPNNRLLTDEMFEACGVYHGVLASWPNVSPVLEQSLSFDFIYRGMTGTPDAFAYNPSINTVFIADLKFGFVSVEVWKNLQLILYAAAVIRHLDIAKRNPRIVLTIVQPRDFNRDGDVRTWETSWAEIAPIVEWLRECAHRAMGPNPTTKSGPQCMNCPGRHACKSAQQSAMMGVEFVYGYAPHDLSVEALGAEAARLYDAQQRLDARLTGLHMQIENLLSRGVSVPFHEMRESRTRRYITPEGLERLKALGPFLGVSATVEKTKGIRELEACFPKELIAMYSRRPKGALKVGRVNPKEAERKFNKRK